MRKLTVLLFIAALAVGDQVARVYAQNKLAEQAAAYYPPSTTSDATIRSFPFLGRLLVGGDVRQVKVGMENLRANFILVRRFEIDLRDVELDRGALFRGEVRVTDIGTGRIEALVDGPSLARAVGADLRFGDESVEIHKRVAGRDLFARARVTVARNMVRLQPTSVVGVGLPASAFALTITIPGADLWPCRADVEAVPEGLQIGCRIQDVPPALVQALQN
jgi:DUF2993 family protein